MNSSSKSKKHLRLHISYDPSQKNSKLKGMEELKGAYSADSKNDGSVTRLSNSNL